MRKSIFEFLLSFYACLHSSISRSFLFIFLVSNAGFVCYSQDGNINVDCSKSERVDIQVYKSEGGVFLRTTTDLPADGKTSDKKSSLSFYNDDLELQWTIEDFSIYNYDYGEYIKKIRKMYKSGYSNWNWQKRYEDHFTLDDKYYLLYNSFNFELSRINLRTQEVESMEIYPNPKRDNNAFWISRTDSSYFYIINQLDLKTYSSDEEARLEFYRIDISEFELERSEFFLPPVSTTEKGSLSRKWNFVTIYNGLFYFKDNHAIKDKESKDYYRRFIAVNQEGKVVLDKMLLLGDQVVDGDHLGDIAFNYFGDGMFYTYSWSRTDKINYLRYSCFDSKLEQEWSFDFPSTVKSGTIQLAISRMSIHKEDELLTVSSYYGRKNYLFTYDFDAEKPNFEILDRKEFGCDRARELKMDCLWYVEMAQNPDIKEWLDQVELGGILQQTYIRAFDGKDRYFIGLIKDKKLDLCYFDK